MSVTIINQNDITFTFQEGDVEQVTSVVSSSVEQYGIPFSTFSSAQLADYEGVVKIITIVGTLTTASSTRTDTGDTKTVAEQKTWLEGLQSGSQVPKGFTSTYESETVMASQMRTVETSGIPNQLPFTLTLAVGAL